LRNNLNAFPYYISIVFYALLVTGGLGKLTTPFVAYKLNCLGPPHFAVPVVAAPIDPLQISVQAAAPVKLVTADPAKLKEEPP
jgi:hypothetical protein